MGEGAVLALVIRRRCAATLIPSTAVAVPTFPATPIVAARLGRVNVVTKYVGR